MKPFKNAVAPLFWLKGESETVLLEGFQKLREAGIFECILEARPFPEWIGKPWFDTLKRLFEEARNTGMRLWIFDDSHFPSGFADGRISEPHRKRLLRVRYADARGAGRFSFRVPTPDPGERFFRAVAAPFVPPDGFDTDRALDITDKISADGTLELEFNSGAHRVFFFGSVRGAGELHTRDYANMLDPEAVGEFIDLVFETHYRHLKPFFEDGTLAGFFSDEPRLGSEASYLTLPDGTSSALPFSEELAKRLADAPAALWPALWFDAGTHTAELRARYMDTVSALYSECFPQKIGAWCRAHGVDYIGHVIEDNGAHTRLGYGDGHFFRAISGQSAAMIDTVLHQNLPGFDTGSHSSAFGPHDAAFFHWGLAKLASSAAHLMSQFDGYASCECFGAYGWGFGLEDMKLQTDHLAVRGINLFVPHAFSNAPFPDADCPPHFYAHGHNPQWHHFHLWREYCTRVAELLTGGIHRSGFAILYHAEAEWSTKPFSPFHKAGAVLSKHQLDWDVIPFDLLKIASVTGGVMTVNGEEFHTLVVPSHAWLPPELDALLRRLADAGLAVVPEAELRPEAYDSRIEILSGAGESLRVLRREKEGRAILFFTNENPETPVRFRIRKPAGTFRFYDALADRSHRSGDVFLGPLESLFAIESDPSSGTDPATLPALPADLEPVPEVSFDRVRGNESAGCEDYVFKAPMRPGRYLLDLGTRRSGTLDTTLNGHPFPTLIAPPYRIDVTELLARDNRLAVTVTEPPSDANCRATPFDEGLPPIPSAPAPRLLRER